MLLYCRTDCCENLDYFLSLSKSICNSIWSRINTVSCTDSLQRMMHTFVFKKKKLGDYFGGRGAHDTARCLQHISRIKSCVYTWPIQLSFLCPKYNSWTEVVHSGVGVMLSLVCWHIQPCFFSAAFSVNEQSLQRAGFIHPAVLNWAQYTILSTHLAGCGYQNIISWHNYLQYFWGIE